MREKCFANVALDQKFCVITECFNKWFILFTLKKTIKDLYQCTRSIHPSGRCQGAASERRVAALLLGQSADLLAFLFCWLKDYVWYNQM